MIKRFLFLTLVFATFAANAGGQLVSHAYRSAEQVVIPIFEPYFEIYVDAYKTSSDMEIIGEKATPAVVIVNGYKERPIYILGERRGVRAGTVTRQVSTGSGFFITSNGYLVTNRHVVDDPAAFYTIDTGEEELKARIIYKDPTHDIAVLKVNGNGHPTLEIADDNNLRIGQDVVGVGNPLGEYVDSVSTGEILALNRKIAARDRNSLERLSNLIATDAKLYPGDSGGPLLDSSGEVIGVNVAIAVGDDISFAIPSDIVNNILKKVGINT
jgi:S1-C subfamily serine protease